MISTLFKVPGRHKKYMPIDVNTTKEEIIEKYARFLELYEAVLEILMIYFCSILKEQVFQLKTRGHTTRQLRAFMTYQTQTLNSFYLIIKRNGYALIFFL